jgi:squalene-hopene/tetraprenyl-beta-curcumene cyclase
VAPPARDWLESVQHADGGWGERCNTYDDPVFKGQGPSTASQTAWAVMGLCAFDDPTVPEQRGIEYLIRTQNPDGSWTEDETTGTGFPKVFYLKYDMYRNAWPLLGRRKKEAEDPVSRALPKCHKLEAPGGAVRCAI